MRRTSHAICVAVLVGGLTACDRPADPVDAPPPGDVAPREAEAPPPKISIMRPEVLAEAQPEPPPPPDPIDHRVMFDVASAELSETARAALDDLLETSGMREDEWALSLTGRTDPSGNAEANLRLAQQRAQSVRDYLVEGGVPAERVQIVAAGEPDVQALSDDDAAMAAARRVDVRAEPVVSGGEAAE